MLCCIAMFRRIGREAHAKIEHLPSCTNYKQDVPLSSKSSGRYYKKSNTVDAKADAHELSSSLWRANTNNANTRCPREYTASERQAQPNSPEPLNKLSPTHPAIDGFLQDVQQRAFLNQVDNLLMDLVNQFHRAGHANIAFVLQEHTWLTLSSPAVWIIYPPEKSTVAMYYDDDEDVGQDH